MAREASPEIDDELFNEVYGKAYSGPITSTTGNSNPRGNGDKRPYVERKSDDEDELYDPNAVPTDFTSRDAKVWAAKAKATERNWKKRKEEEMICKICGESGHFTQGCPSTLGASRKSADFFERVPARDKLVRELFSQKVITQIENDVGCKIRMDEKFLFVHGKDRLILAKGVDAVHKIIQGMKGKSSSPSSPNRLRSRSPDVSERNTQLRRSSSQRSRSPSNVVRSQFRDHIERHGQDRAFQDSHKFSRGSPQATKFGAKDRTAQSKSPRRPSGFSDSFKSIAADNQNSLSHKPKDWNSGSHGADFQSDRKFNLPLYPQSLEELELEFNRERSELSRARDQEEDEENCKHREAIREIRENHMKRLNSTRNAHAKQWEGFLKHCAAIPEQAHQPAYSQLPYAEHDHRKMQHAAAMDSRNRYMYHGDGYSAPVPREAYGEYQHQRPEDFEKAYGGRY